MVNANEQEKPELIVEGRTLAVSNLDKVLYPKDGFTKGELINYYIQIAPVLLPHLKDRPLTMKRYPDGVEGEFFYEKNCPSHRPSWVQTVKVWSESNQRTGAGTAWRRISRPSSGPPTLPTSSCTPRSRARTTWRVRR